MPVRDAPTPLFCILHICSDETRSDAITCVFSLVPETAFLIVFFLVQEIAIVVIMAIYQW